MILIFILFSNVNSLGLIKDNVSIKYLILHLNFFYLMYYKHEIKSKS